MSLLTSLPPSSGGSFGCGDERSSGAQSHGTQGASTRIEGEAGDGSEEECSLGDGNSATPYSGSPQTGGCGREGVGWMSNGNIVWFGWEWEEGD